MLHGGTGFTDGPQGIPLRKGIVAYSISGPVIQCHESDTREDLAIPSGITLKRNLAGRRRGVHYSWVIVGILATVQIIGSSISMAAGIIVAPLNDPDGGFGWSMPIIGGALALYFLVGAIFAPISGWLGDRYGPRRLMLGGSILYGSSMVLLGTVSQVWQFFLFFGVMLSITQSISMVPLMAAVSGWFRRRLGLGVGILWGAGGLGTAMLAPLIGYLLGHVGWQATFWSIGVVGGGVIFLMTAFFRNRPADMGLKPYGARDVDAPEFVQSRAIENLRLKVFNQHMRRTRAFWNLPVIHGLGCAGHGIVLIFAIPIAVDRGVGLVEAAFILTVISLVSIPSRFLTPVLAERYGPKNIMATCLFVQGVTVLILFWAQDVWAFYLFSALFGLGFGGEWTGYLVINRQYFGNGPMGTCYGWQMTGALLGHAFVTVIAGLAIYATGSFSVVLVMSIAFSLAGAVVILMLEPTNQILIPRWQESLSPEARSTPAPGFFQAD